MPNNPDMRSASPTIAIDVTPILPGGENGGAKLFVIELIRGLAQMAPQAKFLLLTHVRSHEELGSLEAHNVRRVLAMGIPSSIDNQARARALYSRIAIIIPGFLRSILAQSAYKVNTVLKRKGRRRLLQQIGADLLYCPFTAPTFYERNIPTVCTIYDLQFDAYPDFFESEEVASRKYTFLEACRKANMLVAISGFSRKSAIDYGNLAPNRIQSIYLRMPKRTIQDHNNSNTVLDRFGVSSNRYLLFPANFWKHKNHEMLITAFGMACARGLPQDMKLVCTGAPGARKKYIVDAATAFGLTNRIVFPGYVRDIDFSFLFKNAGGLIFPSLYEGFGLPIIEAMAAGVPVACSKVAALPEIAGAAAIYFDPKKPVDIAQALIDLVNDRSLRHQLVEEGYRQAKQFSDTTRMAHEYWEVFESVLYKRPIESS